jgi:hypothetical protein
MIAFIVVHGHPVVQAIMLLALTTVLEQQLGIQTERKDSKRMRRR